MQEDTKHAQDQGGWFDSKRLPFHGQWFSMEADCLTLPDQPPLPPRVDSGCSNDYGMLLAFEWAGTRNFKCSITHWTVLTQGRIVLPHTQ